MEDRHDAKPDEGDPCWVIVHRDATSDAQNWWKWPAINGRRMAFTDDGVADMYAELMRKLHPELPFEIAVLPLCVCRRALLEETRARVAEAGILLQPTHADDATAGGYQICLAGLSPRDAVEDAPLSGVDGAFFAVDVETGAEWRPSRASALACCAVLVDGRPRVGKGVDSCELLAFLGYV